MVSDSQLSLVVEPSDTQPWDRREGETPRAYANFRVFRDLPALQRTVEATTTATGTKLATARHWATEWEWWPRANAWDDACHAIEDQERLEAIRSMHKTHRTAGRAALMKALQALQMMHPESMPPSTVARLLELGAKLERATLLTSVEELQGIEVEGDEDDEDPWERIARQLDPAASMGDAAPA